MLLLQDHYFQLKPKIFREPSKHKPSFRSDGNALQGRTQDIFRAGEGGQLEEKL